MDQVIFDLYSFHRRISAQAEAQHVNDDNQVRGHLCWQAAETPLLRYQWWKTRSDPLLQSGNKYSDTSKSHAIFAKESREVLSAKRA